VRIEERLLTPSSKQGRRDKKMMTSWIRIHLDEKKVEPSGEQKVKQPSEQGKSQSAEGSDNEQPQT
jgi:hypothetical protein